MFNLNPYSLLIFLTHAYFHIDGYFKSTSAKSTMKSEKKSQQYLPNLYIFGYVLNLLGYEFMSSENTPSKILHEGAIKPKRLALRMGFKPVGLQ